MLGSLPPLPTLESLMVAGARNDLQANRSLGFRFKIRV